MGLNGRVTMDMEETWGVLCLHRIHAPKHKLSRHHGMPRLWGKSHGLGTCPRLRISVAVGNLLDGHFDTPALHSQELNMESL
jgi:hypothetical protein